MKILVTGGAGFIGSHVVDGLVGRGHAVTVIDDLSTGSRKNLHPRSELYVMDVRSRDAALLVRDLRPDVVIHHAAQMSVSRSVREPLLDADVNVIGSLGLLEGARDAGSRLVFASSGGALYGETDVLPTPESHPTWPISPYGVSKLAFEQYLHCYQVEHGVRYVALRYANVYGPRQNAEGEAGVVASFCSKILRGEQPVINGDGLQTRDYVHIRDVVAANLAAVDSDAVGHYNVGTGRETNVKELFGELLRQMGVDGREVHGPARPGEQRRSVLDCSKIHRELGWRADVSVEHGLADTAAWFRAQLAVGEPSGR